MILVYLIGFIILSYFCNLAVMNNVEIQKYVKRGKLVRGH